MALLCCSWGLGLCTDKCRLLHATMGRAYSDVVLVLNWFGLCPEPATWALVLEGRQIASTCHFLLICIPIAPLKSVCHVVRERLLAYCRNNTDGHLLGTPSFAAVQIPIGVEENYGRSVLYPLVMVTWRHTGTGPKLSSLNQIFRPENFGHLGRRLRNSDNDASDCGCVCPDGPSL